MSRKNKTKKEIVKDIKEVQEATRKRELVRNVIFPFLLRMNESVAYTKVFLQSFALGLDSVFNEREKTTKVSEFIPRLKEVFTGEKQSEKDLYIQLYEMLKDESVADTVSISEMMPRIFEQYFTKMSEKKSVADIPIEELLDGNDAKN